MTIMVAKSSHNNLKLKLNLFFKNSEQYIHKILNLNYMLKLKLNPHELTLVTCCIVNQIKTRILILQHLIYKYLRWHKEEIPNPGYKMLIPDKHAKSAQQQKWQNL